MPMIGSDAQMMARQRLPEVLLPLPLTSKPEVKRHTGREDGSQDQNTRVDPFAVIGKVDARRILDRFEPLPPVLHKALDKNQALRREFQALEKLTQPSPGATPPPPRHLDPGPTSDAPRTLARITFTTSDRATDKGAPGSLAERNDKPLVGNIPRPLTPKIFEPPTIDRSGVVPGASEPIVGNTIQQPVATPRQSDPIKKGSPRNSLDDQPLPSLETPRARPDVSDNARVTIATQTEPLSVFNSRPTPVTLSPRDQQVTLPKDAPRVSFPDRDKNIGPLSLLDRNERHPLVPQPAPEPFQLTRAVSPKSPVFLSDRTVPAQKVLVFQPAITSDEPLTTSTAVASQSATLTGRPVMVSTDENETPPEVMRERFLRSFQRRLQESEVQDIVDSARQLLRLSEENPLTDTVFATQGGNVISPFGSQGTVVGNVLIQSVGTKENGLPPGVETVAFRPLGGDNGGQSTPQPVQNGEVQTQAGAKGSRVDLGINEEQGPPLLNIEPPPPPLPTNVRSRVVATPTINLMDFVL